MESTTLYPAHDQTAMNAEFNERYSEVLMHVVNLVRTHTDENVEKAHKYMYKLETRDLCAPAFSYNNVSKYQLDAINHLLAEIKGN